MAEIKNERGLTVERLMEVLRYDSNTGLFHWNITLSPKAVVGSVSGSVRKSGYRYIAIDGVQYKASRLAWLYVNGRLPERLIDHENRIKSDDRIANLRLAVFCENSWNVGLSKRNTSGFKGAFRTKWGWFSSIMCQGKRMHLGSFRSAADASAAYDAAAKNLHGEFASAA